MPPSPFGWGIIKSFSSPASSAGGILSVFGSSGSSPDLSCITYTHTRRHLNVVIGCAHSGCDKKYNAPDGLSKHIKLKHNGTLIPKGIKQEEAEAVVAELAASSSTW